MVNLSFFNIENRFLKRLLFFMIFIALTAQVLESYVIHPSFTKVLIKTVEDEAIVIARHMSHMFFAKSIDSVLITPEIVDKIERLEKDFNFYKLKIFSSTGETIYSTDTNELGEINENSYFIEVVAKGKVYTKIVEKNSKSLEDKKVTVDIVETYVPVMRKGSFAGALELYHDISDNNEMLQGVLFISNSIKIGLSLSFMIVFFSILFRLDKSLIERNRINTDLEVVNVDLTNTKVEIEKENEKLQNAFFQISHLIQEVSTTGNIEVRYENPNLIKCYEKKQCDNRDCSCFGQKSMRCWQKVGTFSSGEINCQYSLDHKNCLLCDVYKSAIPNPSCLIGENFNNMMHILDVKHKELEYTYDKLKNTQYQLLQQEKMASIGTLAGGIAHEFNNLLAAILGYASLVKDDIPKENEARSDLEKILKAGRRAKDLVKQILTFSRFNVEELSPIKLTPVIDEALKLLKSTTPSSIEVRQEICNDCKNILANSTMIHQVLINLYTNAVQAMDGKGVIDISMSEIHHDESDNDGIYTFQPGNYIKLSVSDSGPGIDKQIKDRIFDPFFTTKEVGQGTGMGLSVVHGIVDKINGSIMVDSEQGTGTTFKIFFPVTSEESTYTENILGPVLTGDETILYVDDEMMLAHMGKQMLERLGYSVTARTSSVEALELFRTLPDKFDLVITDQAMPNITGDELAMSLLQIRPGIPVILNTGYSSTISEERARQIGIQAFVLKPIDKRDLACTIRQVLDGDKNNYLLHDSSSDISARNLASVAGESNNLRHNSHLL